VSQGHCAAGRLQGPRLCIDAEHRYDACDQPADRIAAAEGGVVKIHADAALYAGLFDGDEAATLTIAAGRKAYVHLIRGHLTVNGVTLATGDAALLDKEPTIHLTQGQDAEVLVFDLAP